MLEAYLVDKHLDRIHTYIEREPVLAKVLQVIEAKESRDQMFRPERGDQIIIRADPMESTAK